MDFKMESFKTFAAGIAIWPFQKRWVCPALFLWVLLGFPLFTRAQSSPTNPPVTLITPHVVFSNPHQPARVHDPLNPRPAGPEPLAWDAMRKELNVKQDDTEATVVYSVTNVSSSEVLIKAVRPSCGCTVAKLPKSPWVLAPNESGLLEATIDLRGKRGTLNKYLSVDTSVGMKVLTFTVIIPEAPATTAADMRTRNLMTAMADRQAVFKGDCVHCHVQPTAGKRGEPLYRTACAICHESLHRATMVPDLASVKTPKDRDYWRSWITRGKAGTLMPAFAYNEGGVLSQEQIESLVAYLTSDFVKQRRVVVQPAPPPASPIRNMGDSETTPATNSDLPPMPPIQ
jgi:mono/diheme cytochrome c family protein